MTTILETNTLDYASVYTSIDPERTYTLKGKELIQIIEAEKYSKLDAIPCSVYWQDVNGKILGCNQYMMELFGFSSRREFIGKLNTDFFSFEDAEKLNEINEIVLKTGKRMVFRESGIIGRQQMFFLSSKEPLIDQNGNTIGTIGCSLNETELHLANQKISNTGVMAGTVSHDIQNNIHLFCLYSEKAQRILEQLNDSGLFENVKISKENLEFLLNFPENNRQIGLQMSETVAANLNQMRQVIQDQKEQKADTEKEWYSIAKVVKKAIQSYESHLPYPFIHLENFKDFKFLGDKTLVYNMLSNLFNNALRQIRQHNKGEIFLRTETKSKNYHILYVRDSAGSVTQDIVDQIFTAYKTGKVQGTGFGLSSAKLLMQNLGGDIQAKLVHQDQIEFEIYFPKKT